MTTPPKRLPYEAMRAVREASIYFNYAANHLSPLAEFLRNQPDQLIQLHRSMLAMENGLRFLEGIGGETQPPEAPLEWTSCRESSLKP